MRIPRRLINIAGTLLVIVVLVAGTVLLALPVYVDSLELSRQRGEVLASNGQLQGQIDALRTQEADLPAVEADLEELHRQLPPIPQLDDVTQLVVKAAEEVDATITSVNFAELADFAPRSQQEVLDGLPMTATEVPTDETGKAPAEPAPDAAPGASSPELQFPVTISVTAPDFDAATRFLDELRAGPRLLQLGTISGASGEDAEVTLTVTGLVFVRLAS